MRTVLGTGSCDFSALQNCKFQGCFPKTEVLGKPLYAVKYLSIGTYSAFIRNITQKHKKIRFAEKNVKNLIIVLALREVDCGVPFFLLK
jgi:hypothetical protein